MKTIPTTVAALALAVPVSRATEAGAPDAPAEKEAPRVQLAILLDTSSSMDGLIEQAKTQLWKIVNTFISAKQDGRVPYVEVALYEYGNDGLNRENHWIRRIQPLTRDLDKVSEELFALRTNGGEEYCGAVIKRATEDLQWDPSTKTYKAIFIAGNEPFTQGPVDAAASCKAAVSKGVIVNTIFCGDEMSGLNTGWKTGATAADGSFLTIDSNREVVHVPAPQDDRIVELNGKLNKTYLAYGGQAREKSMNQVAQDTNASAKAAGGAMVQRAVAKASANYHNDAWDLVDAAKEKDFDIAKIKKDDLPEEMRGMDDAAKLAHITAMANERSVIQKEILELNKQRDAFVAEKRRELAGKGGDTLDEVVTGTVRKQAATKGLKFD